MQTQPQPHPRCFDCRHFRNDPDYLEKTFKGLNCLSSGRASVRKDDGICQHHEIYLGANDRCDDFSPR